MIRVSQIGFQFLLVLFFGVQSSHAYVVPSQYLIKKWADKHSGVKSIRVRSLITAYENNKPTDIHFKDTTVFLSDGSNVKAWASDDMEKKLFASDLSLRAISLP